MRYCFDTSIWLDLFEEREATHIHPFAIIKQLVEHIRNRNGIIVYSKAIIDELIGLGYSTFELSPLFRRLGPLSRYVRQTQHQHGRAKDLAHKRNVPLFDALHALLARDNRSLLVSRDRHFQQLRDIVVTKRPEELL